MDKYAITKKIIDIIENKSPDYQQQIERLIFEEFKQGTLGKSEIKFCGCGFPLYLQVEGKENLIEELLKQEVDFRSYREFLYCPGCERFICEIQH
jgi:hypothetical protein